MALSHSLERLTTRGNRIVRARSGEPVVLRGVNRSGLEYNPTTADARITDAEIELIVKGWGANIIRLPFNQTWALERPGYVEELDAVIELAARHGAYTLLDLQWIDTSSIRGFLGNGRLNYVPSLPDENSIRLWRQLAARYRDEPAVLFDIFNEPHDAIPGDLCDSGPVGIEEWLPWARRLVEAIRGEHPEALIFVSGLDWGYDHSGGPMPGIEGVVYSTHVYPGKGDRWDEAFGRLAETHPVFAAEFGGWEPDLDWGCRLAGYLAERGIGWTAWGWPDEPHLIHADRTPTPFGAMVKGLLAD